MAKALLTRGLSPLPVPHTTAHRYIYLISFFSVENILVNSLYLLHLILCPDANHTK
jgi:hypothetical protein